VRVGCSKPFHTRCARTAKKAVRDCVGSLGAEIQNGGLSGCGGSGECWGNCKHDGQTIAAPSHQLRNAPTSCLGCGARDPTRRTPKVQWLKGSCWCLQFAVAGGSCPSIRSIRRIRLVPPFGISAPRPRTQSATSAICHPMHDRPARRRAHVSPAGNEKRLDGRGAAWRRRGRAISHRCWRLRCPARRRRRCAARHATP
jgi:hypothetical protein